MNRWKRIAIGVWCLAGLTTVQVHAAFQATPSSNGEATCELAPLELPLFGGTPVSAFATPSATPTSTQPLNEATATDLIQQFVACVNTGDPTLVWAMFTPRWFAATFADPQTHYLPAFEQMLDQPGTRPAVPLELVEIVSVEQQDDGRYAVRATFRSGDQAWDDTLLLDNVNGQWLIDDVVHNG